MGNRFLCFWDANLNRAREGLRVLEDVARFVLCDGKQTRDLKKLRHALTSTASAVCLESRSVLARASEQDVGAETRLESEGNRRDWAALTEANFNRVGEALRCLEEAAKLVSPQAGKKLKALRFKAYAAEEQLLGKLLRRVRLEKFGQASLYVVLDSRQFRKGLTYASACGAAIAGGAGVIQLRDKTLKGGRLLDAAKALARACEKKGVLFVVNDRPDIAVAANADGVHLGQTDLPVDATRTVVGFDRLVGRSTHSLRQARRAVAEGADYISVGPVYETPSKPGTKAVGPRLVSGVRKTLQIPFVAIGGIDQANAKNVLAAGASLLGVIRAVVAAPNPTQAARSLVRLAKKRKKKKKSAGFNAFGR